MDPSFAATAALSLAIATPAERPAIAAPALSDPQLAMIAGGASPYATYFRFVSDAFLTRGLTLQGDGAQVEMDNWWSSTGVDLIAAGIRR